MHVLIATDGTIDVEQATGFAAALADHQGRVTVLAFIDPDIGLPDDPDPAAGRRHRQSEEGTAALAAALGDAGMVVEVVHAALEAGSGIMGAIGELEPDVVVIDPRAGRLLDGLLSSPGTAPGRRAPCPVLVLRKE